MRARSPQSDGSAAWREELGRLAEVSGLVGFAVVQPVLGPFGESPGSFVAVGATPATIVAFALVVAVVPILVLGGLGAACRWFGPQVRAKVHTAVVAVLAAAAVVVLVRAAGGGAAVRAVVAVAGLVVAVVAHGRWRPVRLFLRYASPTPVALAMVFLIASPVAPLVRPASTAVAPSPRADGHRSLVVIVLDELPTLSIVDGDGAVDGRLFPNVARFASTATWYRDHSAVAPRTALALPSLVTGRLPPEGPERPAVHGQHPDNLFTLFGATHDIHAVEWITELCPASLCARRGVELSAEAESLLGRPVGGRADPLGTLLGEARSLWWDQMVPWTDTTGPDYAVAGATEPHDLARPGLEFLSGLEPRRDRPVLDYLHVPIPHAPWRLLPDGGYHESPHPAGDGGGFYSWADDELGRERGEQARSYHLLQMQWTDRLLGAVFERLQELGRWEETTVVVTADHGVSFRQGQPQRPLVPDNQVDVAWVPLLVKAPGQVEGAVVDDNVWAVDVLPTVAELSGLSVPWEIDGASLVGAVPPGRGATKPSMTAEPEAFVRRLDANLVDLDADGLGEIRAGSDRAPGPDPLIAWRHGRRGDLLGRTVADLGVCSGDRSVDHEPPDGWADLLGGRPVEGDAPTPIWHHGTVAGPATADVVAAVGGVVAGWAPTRPDDGFRFDLLLAEPLVDAGESGDPAFYEAVDDVSGCALRPLAHR